MAQAELEGALLAQLHADGAIADTGEFAARVGQDHNAVVGVMKSLEAAEMIVVEVRQLAARRLRSADLQPAHARPDPPTAGHRPLSVCSDARCRALRNCRLS